ncbi:MAG: YlxR family protein [Lachnospiraceae bacterium]
MSTVKKVPMRQCVGCGEMKSKKEMMRILRTTENEIILDKTGKKNGRGAYICSSPECLKKAVKSKGLERALKTAVSAEVYEGLEREIGKFAEE